MDEDLRIEETVSKLRTRLNDGEIVDKVGRLIQAEDHHYSNLLSAFLMICVTVLLIGLFYINSEHIPIPTEYVWIAFTVLCAGQGIWFLVDARERIVLIHCPLNDRLVVVTNQRVLSLHMSNFDIMELGPQAEVFEVTDADGIRTIAMADGKKIRMKKESDALLLQVTNKDE